MLNLVPTSLRVSLKLCFVGFLLVAGAGCTIIPAALIAYAAHTAPQDAYDAKMAAKAAAAPYKDNYQAIPNNPEHFASFSNQSSAKQP